MYYECYITKLTATVEQDQGNETDNDGDNESGKEGLARQSIYYFVTDAQNSSKHECNLVVVQNQNGEKEWCFYGDTALKEFTDWYLTKANYAIFIAHNFNAYDAFFVLKGLTDEGICPKIVPRGGKILSLSVPGKKDKNL